LKLTRTSIPKDSSAFLFKIFSKAGLEVKSLGCGEQISGIEGYLIRW